MTRRIVALCALAASVWMGASVPVEPAGACDILCPVEALELELAEVRLVEPVVEDELPELPAWPVVARFNAWGTLLPDEGADDATYLWTEPLDEEVP